VFMVWVMGVLKCSRRSSRTIALASISLIIRR
jgi:hypothetical protein